MVQTGRDASEERRRPKLRRTLGGDPGRTLPWVTEQQWTERCLSIETPRGAILTEPALRHEEPRLSPARPSRSRVVVLGWGQFWLFTGILGSLLAMFIVILFAHLSSL